MVKNIGDDEAPLACIVENGEDDDPDFHLFNGRGTWAGLTWRW
jgi:hypothetical protein